jgi:lipopolysaccharide export system permease protein
LIIDRYIASEIAKPMLMATATLVLIFVAYSSAAILNDVVAGEFGMRIVAILIMLRTLITLEVLLPTALFLAVVIGVGRLYRDSEVIALWALGLSELRMLRAVFLVSAVVAIVVACLSIYVRPWAYQLSYDLEERAAMAADLEQMRPGAFHVLGDGRLVMTQQDVDVSAKRAYRVFVQFDVATDRNETGKGERDLADADEKALNRRVIHAQEARLLSGSPEPKVQFIDGYAYEFRPGQAGDHILKFKSLTTQVNFEPPPRASNKRKAVPTSILSRFDGPKEIAEYQWRLSTPIATLLLGLVGLPLSRSNPRQGRHRSLFFALIVYAVFFNLISMARTWVEHADVGPFPGIWWVHLLFAVFLVTRFFPPRKG